MQVRRELRLNSVSGLNRNDYVAGQVCNSRHYSQQLLLASLHREDSGQGGGGLHRQRQGSQGECKTDDVPASSGVRIFNDAVAMLSMW